MVFCIASLIFILTLTTTKETWFRWFSRAAVGDELVDDLTTTSGVSLSYSGPPNSTVSVSDGSLLITQKPREIYLQTFASKAYSYDLSKPTWFHFRFRYGKYLLGSDMYSTLTFYQDNDLSKPLKLTVGINSEQHWKTNYFIGNNLPACEAKTTDDEFFLAVSSKLFPNAEDVRLHYPTGYSKKYTEWTVFSVKYDPPPTVSGSGKFSFYVDGRLVDNLHPIDNPTQLIDPQTKALNSVGQTNLTFSMSTLTDGSEHAYPGNKYGIRGRGCYAVQAPAIPSVLTFPPKFKGNDGSSFKTAWMKHFDNIAVIVLDQMKKYNPSSFIPIYKKTVSSLSPMPEYQTPQSHPADFYKYMTYNYSPTVKSATSNQIWQGIYAGTIDFETAVYMGVIDLPLTSHIMWNYVLPGTRDKMAEKLNRLKTTFSSLPLAKGFVWDILYSVGGTPDIVHFGYLTPEDVHAANVLQYLTPAERVSIPQPSVPQASEMYWDFFKISRNPI